MNEAPLTSPLPASADPAWRAWRAMLDSKDLHFRTLEALNEKYRLGGQRSLSEAADLDGLLAEHTANVHRFKTALQALGEADPAARSALIALLGAANEELGKRPMNDR